MACGTGKTRVAAAAAAGEGVTGMLVPGLVLAAQTIGDWQAGSPVDRVLAVRSDYTVGGGFGASGRPVPVTTETTAVARWLSRGTGRALITGTYDSAPGCPTGYGWRGRPWSCSSVL